MARVIFISPYIKGGSTSRKSNLVHYVATRDGVELLTDDTRKLAPTKKQKEYIARLLRGFPQGKEMFEYEDYLSNPTRETASELIDQMYEQFVEPLDKKENFVDYVANRPGAKMERCLCWRRQCVRCPSMKEMCGHRWFLFDVKMLRDLGIPMQNNGELSFVQ